MAEHDIKNIFLSASIPLAERDASFFKTADVIAIRDAIIALTTVLLPKHRIIWGGHPSITPLINYVMEWMAESQLKKNEDFKGLSIEKKKEQLEKHLKLEMQQHVKLYQSLYFKDKFPPDNERFKNIEFTDNTGDIPSSIQHMRERMFRENDFFAAVFIGGMDGIIVEYDMFRKQHPKALLVPIASTGAASKIVYDNYLEDKFKNERLEKDYGYMSLFQKFLMDKI